MQGIFFGLYRVHVSLSNLCNFCIGVISIFMCSVICIIRENIWEKHRYRIRASTMHKSTIIYLPSPFYIQMSCIVFLCIFVLFLVSILRLFFLSDSPELSRFTPIAMPTNEESQKELAYVLSFDYCVYLNGIHLSECVSHLRLYRNYRM